jgi:hypothetical protein
LKLWLFKIQVNASLGYSLKIVMQALCKIWDHLFCDWMVVGFTSTSVMSVYHDW